MRILCCPTRSPFRTSNRFPGGTFSSSRTATESIWTNLRTATRAIEFPLRLLPVSNSAPVCFSAKLLITYLHCITVPVIPGGRQVRPNGRFLPESKAGCECSRELSPQSAEDTRKPAKITLDAYAASHRAVREMKEDGEIPRRVKVRSSQYLDNLIEQAIVE